MAVRLVNVGFGNVVAAGRIIAIVAPDSAPAKRVVQEARAPRRKRLIRCVISPTVRAGRWDMPLRRLQRHAEHVLRL